MEKIHIYAYAQMLTSSVFEGKYHLGSEPDYDEIWPDYDEILSDFCQSGPDYDKWQSLSFFYLNKKIALSEYAIC